jgi:N-acetylmuramoyl-L-alanine amidase
MACIHTVQQGEYLASIAQQYGFADWHLIYDHPQNAGVKRMRPNPNVIMPGDELYIPDKTQKQESGPTEKRHKFQIKTSKVWLRIVLKDAEDKPIANQPYTLTVAWRPRKGTTDGSGLLQQEIPMGSKSAELSLDKLAVSWHLQIGHLDPVDSADDESAGIEGVQARLNNLGFYCGHVDGILGSRTEAALNAFQKKYGITDSGLPDSTTRSKLVELHGC